MYFITITPPTWTFIIKCNEMCDGAEHKNRYIWWWYISQKKYLWVCICDGMYARIHNGSEGCWDTRTQAGTYWLCLHINIERHGTLVCSLFDFSPLCVDGTYGCVSTLTSRDTALCLRSPFLYCSRLPAIVLQNFSWAICFKLIVKDFFHPQQKCFNVICDLMDGWQLP